MIAGWPSRLLTLTSDRRAAGAAGLRTAAYLLPVVAVFVVGLPTVILPFWSDTAIFSTVGRAISQGGFPYVDAWDQKPPSIYLIYAVAIHGPFRLIANVRTFDLMWTAATVVLLIELGRRWWTLSAGVVSGLVYGVVYLTSSTWWQLAQPDSFIALPVAAGLLLHDSSRGRRWYLVAAGVCLGFAFQLRFIMALLIPFFPLAEVIAAPRARRVWVWLERMIWLGVGFALFQAVLGLYLLAGHALGEYIAATRFATGYTRLGGPWQGPAGPTLRDYLDAVRFSFLFWALGRLILTAPAVIGAIYGVFILRERRVQRLVLFVVLAYVGISAQAKFFWYHYWYMLSFLALLGGWAWDRAFRRIRRAQPAGVAAGMTALLAGGLLLFTPEVLDNGKTQWENYIEYQRRPEFRSEFYGAFGAYSVSQDVAYYVETRTGPHDPLYVWGYDPMIYLLADRASSSRFIYAFPMMSDWAPASWQSEFMDELQARPPVYFIAQHNQGGPWITGHEIDPADYIARFPALQQWLDAGYDKEAEMGDYVLYRRR